MHSVSLPTAGSACVEFSDNGEHLRAELSWLELVLRRELMHTQGRSGKPGPLSDFAGLYVSQDEMRQFLAATDGNGGRQPWSHASDVPLAAPGPELTELDERIRRRRIEIDLGIDAALARAVDLRLPKLVRRFGLSRTEASVLFWCVAPDMDVQFHRCLAFLQNDVGKKRPSVQLLALLCEGLRGVLDACVLLGPTAPLARHRLLLLPQRSAGSGVPLALQQPLVPSQIVDFLSGQDRVDEGLDPFVRLVRPRSSEGLGEYGRHHRAIRDRVLQTERRGMQRPAYIGGPTGSGRSQLVEEIALAQQRRVLRVDTAGLLVRSDRIEEDLASLARDARLHDAVVHFVDVDGLIRGEDRSPRLAVLNAWLARESELAVVLTGSCPSAELTFMLTVGFSGHELPYPTIEERSEIWSALLQGPAGEESKLLIDALASKFRFTPGQIRTAVHSASVRAHGGRIVGVEELHRSCRETSNQRLLLLTRKLAPNYTWDDLVVPDDLHRQLREICSSVRQRRTVYSQWGFEDKFSVGNGLNILFAGPSGTGKTMSAEIIAGDLELDAYKIDLSCVVSKYVGETERNLARIFDEAETSNSILFFDEADALFGKRSEVKDAHDRYANIEINYLLQKLDEYAGIVILATNFKGNMDAAFTRRLTHVVDFPAPDVDLRLLLWKGMFPSDVPMAEDIDFDFLARQFVLSGGHIKNIALNSAFMAAQDGGPVRMEHLIRATKREYDKLGKLSSKSEFGPYMKLLRGALEA